MIVVRSWPTGQTTTARHEPRDAELLLLELTASGIITIAPGCPRWASLAVDRLTLRRDRLEGREVGA